MTREAFGAEFDGADGFLDTATYGVPPRFVAEALRDVNARVADGCRRPVDDPGDAATAPEDVARIKVVVDEAGVEPEHAPDAGGERLPGAQGEAVAGQLRTGALGQLP